jgi:hypothetical protein
MHSAKQRYGLTAVLPCILVALFTHTASRHCAMPPSIQQLYTGRQADARLPCPALPSRADRWRCALQMALKGLVRAAGAPAPPRLGGPLMRRTVLGTVLLLATLAGKGRSSPPAACALCARTC